jgi:hypothetical protein
VIFLSLLLATLVLAQEPWRSKAFTEWSEADVRKVLDDSPWARVIVVDVTWDSPVLKTPPPRPSSDIRIDSLRKGPQVPYLVRWSSARTVRMALARHAMLKRGSPQQEAERFVAREPENHELFITGPDLTPFKRGDESTLRANAFLRIKSSGKTIAPSGAGIMQKREDDSLEAVVFRFARKSPSGEAMLTAALGKVEFVCQSGGAKIRAEFDLKKMTNKEGPDF